MKKSYNSPELNVDLIGQTDVICTSNYESYDQMKDDFNVWYE